jgi:ELWxxDGT repeat protein
MLRKKCTLLIICIFAIFLHTAAEIPVKQFQKITATCALENTIVLNAKDGISGDELWVSDGTADGTLLLKDISPGDGGSSPGKMTAFKQKIYFDAYSPQFQSELWSTDGTPEGTAMFADLTPPNDYSGGTLLLHLQVFDDHLYFVSSKSDLYRTNGDRASLKIIDKAARAGQLAVRCRRETLLLQGKRYA